MKEKNRVVIDDAATFLTMTVAEKREWIRGSELHPSRMPRPREGARALDAVMLPLLDIEVRHSNKKSNRGKEDSLFSNVF